MILRPVAILLGLLASSAATLAGERNTDEILALIERAEIGAVVRPEPGVYHGHLRIARHVILDGAGAVTIDGGGEGTVVEITAPDVVLRNMTVRGSGSSVSGEPAAIRAETGPVVIEDNVVEDALFGIDLRTSPGSVVRRNRVMGKDLDPGRRGDGIRLWWSHGCVVEDNVVLATRDMVFWYSEDLIVQRNTVEDSRYGLHFMYSHRTSLLDNVLRRNSVGVYLMYSNDIALERNILETNRGPSGYGLGLKDCDNIRVIDNSLQSNRVGLYIDNSPSSIDAEGLVRGNRIAFNEIGLLITPNTRGNTIAQNGFIENEEQVAIHGPGALEQNRFSADGAGNYWSDYTGFDLGDDGVGDIPYAPRNLFESLTAREPNLRLFIHSPAQRAIEFTARALPTLAPEPRFSDDAPLMSSASLPAPTHPEHAAWTIACASAGLLGFGAAVVTGGVREPARRIRAATTGAAA